MPMARPRNQADLAAAEAAAEESASRAALDAESARHVRERGVALAGEIGVLNAANHFARWLFRDGSGGRG